VIIIYFFDINVKVIFNPGMKFILSPKWCGNKGKEQRDGGSDGRRVGSKNQKTNIKIQDSKII